MPVARGSDQVWPPSSEATVKIVRLRFSRSARRMRPEGRSSGAGSSNSSPAASAARNRRAPARAAILRPHDEDALVMRHVAERQNERAVAELDRAAHAVAARIGRGVDLHGPVESLAAIIGDVDEGAAPAARQRRHDAPGLAADEHPKSSSSDLASAPIQSFGNAIGSVAAFSRASGSGYQRKRHWLSSTRPLRSAVSPAHSTPDQP